MNGGILFIAKQAKNYKQIRGNYNSILSANNLNPYVSTKYNHKADQLRL